MLNGQMTMVRNASLITGDGVLGGRKDVLFFKGIILNVTDTLDEAYLSPQAVIRAYAHFLDGETPSLVTIQAEGRFLSPGLVDMHSHLGTDSWPEFSASSDTNEMSESAVRSQLRSLDGIKWVSLSFEAHPIFNDRVLIVRMILPFQLLTE